MYTDYTEDNEENYYADDENNNKFDKEKLKRIAFFVLLFVIVVILILLLAKGCSNSNRRNNNNSIAEGQTPTVVMWPSLTLDVGEEYMMEVDVINRNNPNPTYSWQSEDSSIVEISDDGHVTAISEGSTKIHVYYRENNKVYSAECLITVTQNATKLESISLGQDEITLKNGGSLLLQVIVTPTDAKADNLVFESESPEIATVDDKGYIKAISVGTTAVTVKTSDEDVSASVLIHVTENGETTINPTGITLVGLSNGLSVGSSSQVIANIYPTNATNKTIKWTSSDSSIATVDENGKVYGVKGGKCTIIATTSNNISSELEITVSDTNVSVESVTISGDTAITMNVGGTKRLYYTISPATATNKQVKFTSNNSNVVLVDSNGIIAAVGVGNAVVTITTLDGNKTAILNITVNSKNASQTTYTITEDNNYSSNSSSSTSSSSTTYSNDYASNGGSTVESTVSVLPDLSDSCTAYGMTTIEHNEKGIAVVSSISFDNTKPFVDKSTTPTLTITQMSDCITSANYYVFYSSSATGFFASDNAIATGTIKANGQIKLTKGNGYYKINIVGKTKNGNSLTKTYYAHVNKETSSNSLGYISISPSKLVKSGNSITLTKNNSSVTYVYYCVKSSSDTKNCSPLKTSGLKENIYYGGINFSSRINYSKKVYYRLNQSPSSAYGNKICFRAYATNRFVGDTECVVIAK